MHNVLTIFADRGYAYFRHFAKGACVEPIEIVFSATPEECEEILRIAHVRGDVIDDRRRARLASDEHKCFFGCAEHPIGARIASPR